MTDRIGLRLEKARQIRAVPAIVVTRRELVTALRY